MIRKTILYVGLMIYLIIFIFALNGVYSEYKITEVCKKMGTEGVVTIEYQGPYLICNGFENNTIEKKYMRVY